jgi:uncharacterized membrane protein
MKKTLLVTLCIATILTLLNAPSVVAKSLTNPSVEIQATIYPDGSVRIVENRTLRFNGDFTFGFYEIPKKAFGEITDIKISEGDREYTLQYSGSGAPGTYIVSNFTDYIKLSYYFNALNESKTFTFSYLIKDVVSVHEDYGEFYWKLQGDGWDFKVDSFTANLQWQSLIPKEEYFIWAHGPLWGNITKIDDRSAYLEVAPVPSNTFVEVRILLPSSYFSATRKPGTIYEKVLSEEEKWADDANTARDRAKRMMAIVNFIQYLLYILALYLIWNFFRLYGKYGKEHALANESIYYREPPSDLKPALVGMLYNFQKYNEKFLQATMIDLIRRKHLAYDEIPGNILTKDHQLTLLNNEEDKLEDFEEVLLNKIIFEGKTQVTLKGLKAKFQRDKTQYYYNLFNSFKKKIQAHLKKLNFFDVKSNSISNTALGLGLVLIFFGGFAGMMISAFVYGDPVWSFAVLVPVGLLYVIGHGSLKRRTEIGKQEYSKWKAFRLFMKDFSNLKAYGPKSLIIWERFLVYATVFGIASIVLKALKLAAPNLTDMDKGTLMTPALFTAGAIPAFTSLNNAMSGISSMAGSISRTSSSSYSSGSGGGGGFSSGGGGGGGGSRGGFG